MIERTEPLLVPANVFMKSGPLKSEESPFKDSKGYIVSVHYNPIRLTSNYVNLDITLPGLTHKDVQEGRVSVAEIPDCVEYIRIGDVESPKAHRGIDLARSFINDYLQSIVGVNLSIPEEDGGPIVPGIGISTTPTPSKDLIKQLMKRQQRYNNNMIEAGTTLYVQNRQNQITDDHRKAAEYQGVNAIYSPRPHNLADTKKCIACAEDIKAAAVICRFCNMPQDNRALERALAAKYDAVGGDQAPVPAPPKSK